MLRFFFKKKRLKKTQKKLLAFYKSIKNLNNLSLKPRIALFDSLVFQNLPKRQQHFNFININSGAQNTLTSGFLLKSLGRKAKFFKRNPKNITGIVLHLKKNYLNFFKNVYIYSIKNFNKRQFLMFKKIQELLTPSIEYFIHKKSYIPRFLPKKKNKKKNLKISK